MLKLIYVKDSKNSGYTVLGIARDDGARAYTVETTLYMRIGSPLPSDVISDEEFADITLSDEKFRSTKKALSLLTYSDNNRVSLLRKLRVAGFSSKAIESTVDDMQRLGYINEERQLERLILAEAKIKLTGRARFIPKLMAKGYKRSNIEAVTARLSESGELDFDEIKAELIRKKLGDCCDEAELKKLLYKHGFLSD